MSNKEGVDDLDDHHSVTAVLMAGFTIVVTLLRMRVRSARSRAYARPWATLPVNGRGSRDLLRGSFLPVKTELTNAAPELSSTARSVLDYWSSCPFLH